MKRISVEAVKKLKERNFRTLIISMNFEFNSTKKMSRYPKKARNAVNGMLKSSRKVGSCLGRWYMVSGKDKDI